MLQSNTLLFENVSVFHRREKAMKSDCSISGVALSWWPKDATSKWVLMMTFIVDFHSPCLPPPLPLFSPLSLVLLLLLLQ